MSLFVFSLEDSKMMMCLIALDDGPRFYTGNAMVLPIVIALT